MTINLCRHHCRDRVKQYAFLNNGNTCFCGTAIPRIPASDMNCGIECTGDSRQVCGDDETSSVYDGMLKLHRKSVRIERLHFLFSKRTTIIMITK